jgi:hypothetical protein
MRIDADGRRESFCSRFGGTCTASQQRMLAFVSARKCHICQHSVRIYPVTRQLRFEGFQPFRPAATLCESWCGRHAPDTHSTCLKENKEWRVLIALR